MILIIYSKLTRTERHTIDFFSDPNLNTSGKRIVCLDAHSFGDCPTELKMSDGLITLNGHALQDFENVICLNIPRCDAILRIDDDINLPSLFRWQSAALIDDISHLIDESKWIPGTINSILRGHSKLFVFQKAQAHGLLIPQTTTYSQASMLDVNIPWYKKSLGFPCMLSFDKATQEERLINSTNRPIEDNDRSDKFYWQWQTPIKATAQIRCQIIGDKIWAVEWVKKSTPYLDLRQVVSSGNMPDWKPTTIPDETAKKLVDLMRDLKISVASPELFVTEDGQLIFFDLNPCGDMRGFFPTETVQDMVKSVYDLCK